jgi:hypothetical protein
MIALAERSSRLTVERLDELLDLAVKASEHDFAPVAPGGVRQRIFGRAQWLMGRRQP